ncbi:MAG: DUF3572 domain-containing protein [Rhodomicrobium sp.]|nr:DUF3572 domain-containing protein [Rhodomicrobium sp.]
MAASRPKYHSFNRGEAESLAIDALAFIASEETLLARFVAATGYDLAGIRAEAGSPYFLAGVLDFLLGDESLLLVFAGHGGTDPASIGAARRALLSGSPEAE